MTVEDFKQQSALRRACRSGDVASVSALLQAGAQPNDTRPYVQPLTAAAEGGNVEVLELLVAAGAEIAWSRPDGWTALTFADAGEHRSFAERLVGLGAPESTQLAHGYTELHRAARRGAAADELLRLGRQDLDRKDATGDTPLMLSIRFHHSATAAALVAAGADVNAVSNGYSVLATAAYADSVGGQKPVFVAMVLEAGASPNPPGYSPLQSSINQEGVSSSVMSQLVEAGTDVHATSDHDGETVLHRIASIAGAHHVVLALELGADIEARDALGRTPLLAAAHAENAPTFAALVESGANTNALDAQGMGVLALVGGDRSTPDADLIRSVLMA